MDRLQTLFVLVSFLFRLPQQLPSHQGVCPLSKLISFRQESLAHESR